MRGVLFWGYKRKSPLAFPNAPQSAFLDGLYTITVLQIRRYSPVGGCWDQKVTNHKKILLLLLQLLPPTTLLAADPLDISPPVPGGQCRTAIRMPHTPGLTKIRQCLGRVLAGFGLPSRARGSWRLPAPPEAATATSAPAPAPCARGMPRQSPARQTETEIW